MKAVMSDERREEFELIRDRGLHALHTIARRNAPIRDEATAVLRALRGSLGVPSPSWIPICLACAPASSGSSIAKTPYW
jgi:hypothetical protein